MVCCLSLWAMANVTVTGERQTLTSRSLLCTHAQALQKDFSSWRKRRAEWDTGCGWARDAPALGDAGGEQAPGTASGLGSPFEVGALLQPAHKATMLAANRTKDFFLAARCLPFALGKALSVCQLLWGDFCQTWRRCWVWAPEQSCNCRRQRVLDFRLFSAWVCSACSFHASSLLIV